MKQARAHHRPVLDTAEVSLAGLVQAQELHRAVCTDPAAPLAVSIIGPGGFGKSAVLAALRQAYLAAGVQVVGTGAAAVGLKQSSDVAVLVDDAHELAGADLDRLRRLALTGHGRLAVAYRPWPRKPELDELEDILGHHHPPVLLGRLDQRGTQIRSATMLGQALPATVVDLLWAQTGGVPRLVDQVLAAFRHGSTPDEDHPELPPDVVDRVRRDLDRLGPQLRALLLAVGLGAAVDHEILTQVLGLDPTVVGDLLSTARASGLLLDGNHADDQMVPLVRRALVAGATPGVRRMTQRLVLAAHLEHDRPVLRLARELVEAGARGSDLAAIIEAAADAALADAVRRETAPADAVRSETTSADAETASSDAAVRAAQLYTQAAAAGADGSTLATRRAEAAALAGDLDGALRMADQVLSDPSGGDLGRAGDIVAAILAQRGLLARSAEMYGWIGTSRMGSAAPLAALALLGSGSLAQARKVLAAADDERPPTLLAGAASLMASGVLESVNGSATLALSTLTQAAALLEPGGQAVLLPDTPAALAAIVALHCGELDVAVSVLERALAAGAGGPSALARHQLLLAWTAMIRGDDALARRRLIAAVGTGRTREPREGLLAAALEVGLARREGDILTLQTVWGAAREAIVRYPADLFTLLPLGELAVAAARLRDFDRMVPHLDQAWQLLQRLGDPPLWSTPLHWYGLHAAILREQPGAAEPHAAALMAAAKSSHYATLLAAAGRAWAQVLAGQFDPSAVESAARGLRSIGLANDGSRLAGQAAIRTTDRKAMAGLLGCARALQATGPGAAGALESSTAVEGGVNDQPEPVPPARAAVAPAGPAMLSDREREVAELVLAGLTYRQIGERLFISAKTVEHHVARMRQRLNATSRDELFAQLRLLVGDRAGALLRPSLTEP